METLTLTETDPQHGVQHLQAHQEPHQHHQLVNIGDISDFTHELHDEIVTIPKEVMLISLVAQEQALYNPKHEFYRNTNRKDAKWLEIAETVGWTEVQCKSKWKAMRDQYCRELKRSKFNTKAHVKWKYFKELEFLRPFALSRNYRPRVLPTTTSATTTTTTATATKSNNLNAVNGIGNASSNCNKLPSIKMESGQFTSCEFTTDANVILGTDDKSDPRLLSLTDEQLNTVMQQHSGGWSYLTTSTPTRTTETTDTNLIQNSQQQQHHVAADDMLCALVESVTAAAAAAVASSSVAGQMQQVAAPQQNGTHNDEEDDDPIHTFLNMESFFEKDLIGMVQQEDILYNNYHPNYRNSKMKLEVWDDIARKLKKPVARCRLKWKALRDQYIREHKRLKDRENSESLPRWKHYDALCFLQKFIKHKTSDFDTKTNAQLCKNGIDADIDDHMIDSSPLQSPVEASTELGTHDIEQQTLPALSGPHSQQQQHHLHTNTHDICVVNANSVTGYDEMDIDNYIIGHASDAAGGVHDDDDGVDGDVDAGDADMVGDDDDDDVIGEDDDDEDRKSHQHFPDYATPSTSNSIGNNSTNQLDNCNDIEVMEQQYEGLSDKHSNTMTQQHNVLAALQKHQQQQQQLQQQQQQRQQQQQHQQQIQQQQQQQHQQQMQQQQQQQHQLQMQQQQQQQLQLQQQQHSQQKQQLALPKLVAISTTSCHQTNPPQQQHQRQQQQQHQQHMLNLNVLSEEIHTATLHANNDTLMQQQQQLDFGEDIKPLQQQQQQQPEHQQSQQQHQQSQQQHPQSQQQHTHTQQSHNNILLNNVATNLSSNNVANMLTTHCGMTIMSTSGSSSCGGAGGAVDSFSSMNGISLHVLNSSSTSSSSSSNNNNNNNNMTNSTSTAALLVSSAAAAEAAAAITKTTTMCTTNSTAPANNCSVSATPTTSNNVATATTTNNTPTTTTTTDNAGDDEVGAFFKAVAMKIRSAKMSPVAFTDLQIDILRVINETLRHH